MLAAAATVLLAMGVLLAGDHRYFWYGDTPAAYYGWWYRLGDLVRHGEWPPLVDPHAWRAGGIAAEGQWGAWSPLTVGIGLLATVTSHLLVLATSVKVAFAVVGALGTFRLVRSYDAPPAAAYVAAVAVPMGGMTQYLDLPSWAAAEMIWALLPWVWWALRRTMTRGANPLPALVLGYLLVSVGYVFGTIMLIVVLVACLVDSRLARDWAALRRVLVSGVLLGLVALTVYLPGVLTASVTAREEGYRGFFGGKFTTDPLGLFASVLPTAAIQSGSSHLLPYAYVAWFLPAALWLDWGRARREWRPLGGLLLFTVATLLLVDGPAQIGPLRWPLRLQPFLVVALVVLLVVAWHRFGLRPTPLRLALSLAWVALAGLLALVRAPSMWAAQVCAVAVVAAGISLVWWLVVHGRLRWVAPTAGGLTLALLAIQHGFYPTPPSPQRNAPTDLGAYQAVLPGAVGDVFQVGATDLLVQRDPQAARQLLIGSGWYLGRPPGAEHLHRDQPARLQGALLRLLRGRHLPGAARHPVQHGADDRDEARRPARRELPVAGPPGLPGRPAGASAGRLADRRPHAVHRALDPAYARARSRWRGVDLAGHLGVRGHRGRRRHVVPRRRRALRRRHRGAEPARLARVRDRRGQPGRPRGRLSGDRAPARVGPGRHRARRLPPTGLDGRGRRMGAGPAGRSRLVALLRRTPPPPRPGGLAAAQPRARSVRTVWPLSLTKVSTSWRPSVSERTFVALLRERRIADPGQP